MLELAILGLLKEQDLHGYELKKRLAETLGPASTAVSFGSLYPALARLERAGAVRSVEPGDGPEIPQTGSLGGELAVFRARSAGTRRARSRKVYAITVEGEELFARLLEDGAADDGRLFSLRLAFARYLPDEARLGMLERRRLQLQDRLTRARAARERLDTYLHSLLEHDREATEHDLSWVERLIAKEREARTAAAVGGMPARSGIDAPTFPNRGELT